MTREMEEKKARACQGIVDVSMLTEQVKKWMKEYLSQTLILPTCGDMNRYVEQVVMPPFLKIQRRREWFGALLSVNDVEYVTVWVFEPSDFLCNQE
jgi:hypothetical protein